MEIRLRLPWIPIHYPINLTRSMQLDLAHEHDRQLLNVANCYQLLAMQVAMARPASTGADTDQYGAV